MWLRFTCPTWRCSSLDAGQNSYKEGGNHTIRTAHEGTVWITKSTAGTSAVEHHPGTSKSQDILSRWDHNIIHTHPQTSLFPWSLAAILTVAGTETDFPQQQYLAGKYLVKMESIWGSFVMNWGSWLMNYEFQKACSSFVGMYQSSCLCFWAFLMGSRGYKDCTSVLPNVHLHRWLKGQNLLTIHNVDVFQNRYPSLWAVSIECLS